MFSASNQLYCIDVDDPFFKPFSPINHWVGNDEITRGNQACAMCMVMTHGVYSVGCKVSSGCQFTMYNSSLRWSTQLHCKQNDQ